jgi:hypothetical protein
MSETEKGISSELGKVLQDYTWLVVDFFLFLLLISFFLGYKDFDQNMRLFLRGAFVFSLWFFSLSGFHILIVIHHLKADNMPAWLSYVLFLMKPIIVGAFFYWAVVKGLL